MKKKKKFNNRFLYAAASITLAAVIAFIAIPTISSKTNGKAQIVRVNSKLSRGTLISEADVSVVEMGSYNLPDNAARLVEDVVGKYAAADLAPGDMILPSKVSETPISSDAALYQIPSGKLAYSLTVKTLASGLSDKLQRDDIIRIYHYKDKAQDFPELQFVRVLSVTDSDGIDVDYTQQLEEGEERRQTSTITVLADPGQALLLTSLENDGVIQAALVCRGDKDLADKLIRQQDEEIKKAADAAETAKKAKEKQKEQEAQNQE